MTDGTTAYGGASDGAAQRGKGEEKNGPRAHQGLVELDDEEWGGRRRRRGGGTAAGGGEEEVVAGGVSGPPGSIPCTEG